MERMTQKAFLSINLRAGTLLIIAFVLVACAARPTSEIPARPTSQIPTEHVKPSNKPIDLAEFHLERGEYDLAIEHAKKAIALDPVNAQRAWFCLGLSYYRKGQTEDARRAFDQILKLKSVDNFHERAYRWLGATYHFEDFDKALTYYNKALELAPGNKDTILSRGFVYVFKGLYGNAIQDFNSVLKRQGLTQENKSEAYRGMAFAYLGLGELEKPFAMLQKAEEASANYSSLFDMGLVYYALGDEKKLKEHFAKKGFLGVELRDNKDFKAAEVVKVREGSPAQKAGMLKGDIVLQLDDVSLEGHADFTKKLSSMTPGATVTLTIERAKEAKTLSVILGTAEVLMSKADMEKSPLIGVFLAKERFMRKAQEAERNNDPRTAFQAYMNYIRFAQNEPLDDRFIERIIKLVKKLDPPPAIPEEARRHAIRAEVALKKVKSDEDYTQVFGEFEKATRLAPWWGDAHLNYGLAQEAAGEPAGAIRSFKIFLLASPEDNLSGKLRNKIYALEVEAEKLAQFRRWEGKWRSESGSSMRAKVKGNTLTMLQVHPSSTAQSEGWRPGDVVFHGTINDSRIEGKSVTRTKDQRIIRCFGERFETNMTGILIPEKGVITTRVENENFNISNCSVNYVNYFEYKYTRVLE